jgi:TatD DNase family protein
LTAGLIDTHAHLDYFDPEDLPHVLSRAQESGVDRIITIGTDLASSRRAVEIATADDSIYAAVGVHPHDVVDFNKDARRELAMLAENDRVVAIGETGLDYYRMLSPREAQIAVFGEHIELATRLKLPLIIHCRDAYDDLKSILAAKKPEHAVLHCFSGDPADVEVFLDLGCYISFSGTVTFGNAPNLREAAALVPWDRLLVETDCPYLTPHPHRGRRNEPAYVKLVAEKIAEVKGVPFEKVVKETSANADRFFCL